MAGKMFPFITHTHNLLKYCGYGLLCDVDGVLYCYGVNKPEPEGDGKEGRK